MFSDPCIDCGVDRPRKHACFVGQHPRCRPCSKKCQSIETRQKISKSAKDRWSNHDHREHLVNAIRAHRLAIGEKQKIWKRKERSQWSLDVRKRDDYTCRTCLTKGIGRQMHAHHILSAAKYPEYSLMIENGITLCVPCHRKIHEIIAVENK